MAPAEMRNALTCATSQARVSGCTTNTPAATSSTYTHARWYGRRGAPGGARRAVHHESASSASTTSGSMASRAMRAPRESTCTLATTAVSPSTQEAAATATPARARPA